MENPNDPNASPDSGLNALRATASQGDAEAQFSLGLRYGSAPGDAQDFDQAGEWYRRAADQDHALAQYNLGVMFARGQGMPADDAAAATWMRKAAEGGDAGGQHSLGQRCQRASLEPGSPDAVESRIEAYKWFQLAAQQGYKGSAPACQSLTLTMSQTEVDEGDRRIGAFVTRST